MFTFNFISLIFQDWFQVSSTLFAIRAAEQWRDNSNWWKQLHGHDSLFTWFIHKIVAEKKSRHKVSRMNSVSHLTSIESQVKRHQHFHVFLPNSRFFIHHSDNFRFIDLSSILLSDFIIATTYQIKERHFKKPKKAIGL